MICFFKDEQKLKRMDWAKNGYSQFIDFKNEQLKCEDKESIEEFPITSKILKELIVFWTQMYAVTTIRCLISCLHAYQIDLINIKFKDKHWNTIKDALKIAKKQRDIMCRQAKRRLELLIFVRPSNLEGLDKVRHIIQFYFTSSTLYQNLFSGVIFIIHVFCSCCTLDKGI